MDEQSGLTKKDIVELLESFINYYQIRKKIYKKSPTKIGRMPNFPEDISENIIRLLIEKEHNYTPEWIKGGDLMYNNDKIEVKTFTSSGPSSFGPKESWKTIYFLDATKFLQNYYICYEVNLQNDDEKWKNIKVNKKQTFHDQCAQKRRPRISFSKILPQLDKSDVKKRRE